MLSSLTMKWNNQLFLKYINYKHILEEIFQKIALWKSSSGFVLIVSS